MIFQGGVSNKNDGTPPFYFTLFYEKTKFPDRVNLAISTH
jgi:hypothetical protein